MNITLNFKNTEIKGEALLPASKSISNRVLIINALAENETAVTNLSDCDDTKSMLRVLQSDDCRFDVGHAGTAMRFLTAYLSRIVGKWEITGSDRMKQRPISVLVDALNQLGARIEYIERSGFPPLRIMGSFLMGGTLEISASVSSQYISALMMIAPYMKNGLKLTLTGKIVSRTYIDMTIAIMKQFGAQVDIKADQIIVHPHPYHPAPCRVESDWSGASYFYELIAVAPSGEITLGGLLENSLQGDARQKEVWEKLGVDTCFRDGKVVLRKNDVTLKKLKYDFVEMPDLAQTFAVTCCLKEIPFEFSGVETLRIKETDRITALIKELAKLGYNLSAEGDNILKWDGTRCPVAEPVIETYHDHRMAMAFAPAAIKHPGLTIVDKDVVSKSFPDYWEQLESLGILLQYH